MSGMRAACADCQKCLTVQRWYGTVVRTTLAIRAISDTNVHAVPPSLHPMPQTTHVTCTHARMTYTPTHLRGTWQLCGPCHAALYAWADHVHACVHHACIHASAVRVCMQAPCMQGCNNIRPPRMHLPCIRPFLDIVFFFARQPAPCHTGRRLSACA
eukprot:355211-Chlamydomonas_euryale.AAC.5